MTRGAGGHWWDQQAPCAAVRQRNACLPLLADRGITTTLCVQFCGLLLKRQCLLSFQGAGKENGNIGCTLRRGARGSG